MLFIAAGSIAHQACEYILDGTGITLVNDNDRLPHPCTMKKAMGG